MVSGSSAFFLFGYAIQFYSSLGMTRLVSSILFFGYMGLASLAFFLLTGTIGFMATLVFVRKIYATIKID
jgi:transmembrane 9 superfamily protein 2/4